VPGKAKVLVVEDNADMNRFVAECLSAEYQVVCAFDGRQGLEKALAFRPDLIVSDIMMPHVSGEEMIRELRNHPEMQETPILLLSAKADDDLKIRLLEGGAQEFITKPFTEGDLLVRVGNLVDAKQARDTLRAKEQDKRSAIEAANLQLQAQSEHLKELFQQAPTFMAVLRGPDHVFELANAAYYQIVGERDLIGKPLLEALPEMKDQGFIDVLDRVLATGEPYVGTGLPALLEREHGTPLEERYMDLVYQPLAGAGGSVSGVFVVGHDVTDRKRAEDALRAADRRKDEFLATLAHELRNPLAPIRHAAQISRTPHATEAQVKWSQEVIDRQVGHMARLLDDLLEVSRITRGMLELRKERIVLRDVVAAAVETVRPLIEARGHHLTLDLPAASTHIDADPVRLSQIFSNLLTNAAKYTNAGGRICVVARAGQDKVTIEVRDNGMGISPEQLPRMFEMFSQATSAIERSEGGLGIGLALVRGLVVLHGGTIEAHSRGLGKGSEFVLTFPLAPVEPGRASDAVRAEVVGNDRRTGLRVLVADDNRDTADSSALLLQISGHDVRTAYSGAEALRLAAEFMPQVALLDIGMPGMNGYEVAREIRGAGWGERMMLVAISGWGQADDKRLAEAAGFDHHLAKPVDFEMLHPLLRQVRDDDP
jgi:PAS domain S-box-containing protein